MAMNFQDVLRDVHNETTHTLQTSGSGQASVVLDTGTKWIGLTTTMVGNTTANPGHIVVVDHEGSELDLRKENENWNAADHGILMFGRDTASTPNKYRAINLSAEGDVHMDFSDINGVEPSVGNGASGTGVLRVTLASDSTGQVKLATGANYIGLATVNVSNPTLYAVVNTAAAGDSTNNIGFATVAVSNATLYAVVNTGAVGITNSIVTVANTVSTTFSGNVTLDAGSKTQIVGNLSISSQVAWADPKTYIGLVTVANTVPVTWAGNVTLDAGSKTGIVGNITISPSVNWIGFATITPTTTTRSIAGNLTIDSGNISLKGNVTLSDSKTYIGLASVNVGAIAAGATFIGLVSVQGNVVTGGTNKTLVNKNIAISASGDATILVPSATFKITHLTLGSDATVRVSIKSGATYLLGNASVGITLFPGGGWVENGQPASPIYIGLAVQDGFVVNTSATANVGGKVVYFDE